jgi:hypothetical protein
MLIRRIKRASLLGSARKPNLYTPAAASGAYRVRPRWPPRAAPERAVQQSTLPPGNPGALVCPQDACLVGDAWQRDIRSARLRQRALSDSGRILSTKMSTKGRQRMASDSRESVRATDLPILWRGRSRLQSSCRVRLAFGATAIFSFREYRRSPIRLGR